MLVSQQLKFFSNLNLTIHRVLILGREAFTPFLPRKNEKKIDLNKKEAELKCTPKVFCLTFGVHSL